MCRIIALFLFVWSISAKAQSNLSLKYFGLTIHPFGDNTARHQPYKLDKNAFFVANYGGFIEYEKYIVGSSFALKVGQGIFADCSNGWASATFFGFKGFMRPWGKHRLGFAIGPLFVVRESWSRFSDYGTSKIFKERNHPSLGMIQYAFYPYGMVIDYDYQLSPKTDLSVGFTPGFPFVMTFSVGVKYWFSKEFKEKQHHIIKIR